MLRAKSNFIEQFFLLWDLSISSVDFPPLNELAFLELY
jgi:hypothetical protein